MPGPPPWGWKAWRALGLPRGAKPCSLLFCMAAALQIPGGQLGRRGQEKEGAPAHRGAEGLKHGERAAFYLRETRTQTRTLGPAQAPVLAFGLLVTQTPDSASSRGPPEGQEAVVGPCGHPHPQDTFTHSLPALLGGREEASRGTPPDLPACRAPSSSRSSPGLERNNQKGG